MSDSVVFPRARRRRLKPPGPLFWYWLFWTLWATLWLFYDLVRVMRGHPLDLAFAAIQAVLLFGMFWPRFKVELGRWRRDNE